MWPTADLLVLAVPVLLLTADAVLAVKKKRVITDVLRDHKVWYITSAVVLTAHVLDVLGPFDPFRGVSNLFDWVF